MQVPIHIDSGFVENTAGAPRVVFSTIVQVPRAAWLRLSFDGVLLAGDESGGSGSYLRMTSLLDGAVQTQHRSHVAQWRSTSAYFNGDAVLVELHAHSGTGRNRVVISEATAGMPVFGPESICGPTDDRTLSNDPRCARNQPTGCTSWMINDCNHCFLTAGHCAGSGLQVVEFNVPLSSSSGSLRHPSPSHQYSVDPASVQTNGGQGVGNDWTYFGVFANSTTGLTPYQAQGQAFDLAPTPPPVQGQNIRITGYGTVSSPISPTWNQVQKTHAGPYYSFVGTTLRYTTDTTGGNSGSPVIDDSTGRAIGIHTHAGCDPANHGTGSNHPGLQNALANPRGVCFCPGLSFSYPGGLPDQLDPSGGTTVRVVVAAAGANTPQPGTGSLHYDAGSGWQRLAMQQVSGNTYDAVFPALPCPATVQFYFSARSIAGATFTDPDNAPAGTYSALAVDHLNMLVSYDFNTAPQGWSVQNTSLSSGAWTRAVPAGSGGSRSDPARDFDGSGACWVTGNGFDEDVDGGPTILTTETFDLSATTDPQLRYARWIVTNDTADFLDVEVFDSSRSAWIRIERAGNTAGWLERTVRLLDHVNPAGLGQVRLRFSVADNPNNSVTEAGLDAFEIFDLACVHCQPDIGFGGPGSAQLSVCGGDLSSGTSADLAVTGARALAAGYLVIDTAFTPTPLFGGTIVGFGGIPVRLDASGEYHLAGIPGGGGPASVYTQLLYLDNSLTQGFGFSNAVRMEFRR